MFGLRDIDLKHTRFYQDAVKEGQLEGLEKGVRKGRIEGEATLLLRQLERRFGSISTVIRQRITNTDAETLLIYGERILDAQSLDEIFGD